MAFCVAVGYTVPVKYFGADNSVPGVIVLLAVLVLRQAFFAGRCRSSSTSVLREFFNYSPAGPNYQYDASG